MVGFVGAEDDHGDDPEYVRVRLWVIPGHRRAVLGPDNEDEDVLRSTRMSLMLLWPLVERAQKRCRAYASRSPLGPALPRRLRLVDPVLVYTFLATATMRDLFGTSAPDHLFASMWDLSTEPGPCDACGSRAWGVSSSSGAECCSCLLWLLASLIEA